MDMVASHLVVLFDLTDYEVMSVLSQYLFSIATHIASNKSGNRSCIPAGNTVVCTNKYSNHRSYIHNIVRLHTLPDMSFVRLLVLA
jgi:hypothetical protein